MATAEFTIDTEHAGEFPVRVIDGGAVVEVDLGNVRDCRILVRCLNAQRPYFLVFARPGEAEIVLRTLSGGWPTDRDFFRLQLALRFPGAESSRQPAA